MRSYDIHGPIMDLMVYYSPDSEQAFLDPEGPLEAALQALEDTPEVLRRSRDALSDLLAEPGVPEEDLSRVAVPWVGLPTGGTYRAFLHHVVARVDNVLAHPEVPVPRPVTWPIVESQDLQGVAADGDRGLRRRSRFTDRATAERAVRDVLRAHEPRLRSWVGDQAGEPLLHLYAALDREVGTVRDLDLVGRPVGVPAPARSCVVLMRLDQASGNPVIATSHPEIDLDTGVRERFPDLPLLFGGYFGQDVRDLYVNRWTAEYRLNTQMSDAVRHRLIDQLRELLTLDDDALGQAVEALGCYTVPSDLRRWVEGLLRRMNVLDWSRETFSK